MSTTRIEYLDSKVQYGRGKAADVYGQVYNVYRLRTQNGSIFSAPPIFADFAISPEKAPKTKAENQTYDLQIFAGTCDNSLLKLGDVFREVNPQDPPGDQLVFAQRRRFKGQSLFIRCEATISVTRPAPRGGRIDQMPASGVVAAQGYFGVFKRGEFGMKLTNGEYYFASQLLQPSPGANTAFQGLAGVPAALLQDKRIRDAVAPKIPVALFREHFVIYVPLLNGIQLQELDRLNFPNSDRYEIASFFTSETAGFSGYICICEKLGT